MLDPDPRLSICLMPNWHSDELKSTGEGDRMRKRTGSLPMAWGLLPSKSARHGLAGILFAAALGGLSAIAAHAEGCAAPGSPMSQVEIYFGSSVKGRPFVTTWAWSQFLASDVTPRFPDGLTAFDAHGQWRSGDG